MDKDASRHILAAAGVPVADGLCIDARSWTTERERCLDRASALIAGSAYVKPNAGGSSVHTHRVSSAAELEAAIEDVLGTGDRALVEAAVHGTEATSGVLGNAAGTPVALPPVEIVPHAGRFFDYEEKYRESGATEHCPPKTLSAHTVARLGELALIAHRVTGCDGYSRTDFIVPSTEDGEGDPIALEINTLPGLTERSLFPQSMRAAGLSYRDMCLTLLELAVERAEGRSRS
jgi:D-alanine-D-alanine ligase